MMRLSTHLLPNFFKCFNTLLDLLQAPVNFTCKQSKYNHTTQVLTSHTHITKQKQLRYHYRNVTSRIMVYMESELRLCFLLYGTYSYQV